MEKREEQETVTYGEIKCRYYALESKKDKTRHEVESERFLRRWITDVEKWLIPGLSGIFCLILLFQTGCATAEAIGYGLGRTLQAAGSDTCKIVKAVSKDRDD